MRPMTSAARRFIRYILPELYGDDGYGDDARRGSIDLRGACVYVLEKGCSVIGLFFVTCEVRDAGG